MWHGRCGEWIFRDGYFPVGGHFLRNAYFLHGRSLPVVDLVRKDLVTKITIMLWFSEKFSGIKRGASVLTWLCMISYMLAHSTIQSFELTLLLGFFSVTLVALYGKSLK